MAEANAAPAVVDDDVREQKGEESASGRNAEHPSANESKMDRAPSLDKGESSPEDYSPDSNEPPSPSPTQLRAWKQADLDDYR